MSKVVGIDSSTTKTGIAIFIDEKYEQSILIDKSKVKDSSDKFDQMCNEIVGNLNEINPDVVAIERIHTVRNPDTFRKLCKIMGIVHGWCIINRKKYFEYSPAEWRKAVKKKDEKVPRTRIELKLWSVNKVKEKYGIEVTDDVADAICVANAHINKSKEIHNGKD